MNELCWNDQGGSSRLCRTELIVMLLVGHVREVVIQIVQNEMEGMALTRIIIE